jgi:hypothetical protein
METPGQWRRPLWQPGDYPPYVFTVVYGLTDVPSPIDVTHYRIRGVPESVAVHAFSRTEHGAYLRDCFEEGYAWNTFAQQDPELAEAVRRSTGAVAMAGEVDDSSSLLYLRDIIGMTAHLLDHGGLAVYDPFTFRWFRPDVWLERYFEPDEPDPQRHVMIFYSKESDGFWLHTRGLLTFGRPDISLRGVADDALDHAFGMINELIDTQAAGAFLQEGKVVEAPSLGRFIVRYEGDHDDPEFNNVHIELTRPRS